MPEETERISMVLPRSMLKALRAASKREKRPYSAIIREALENYLGVPDTVQFGGTFGQRAHKEEEEEEGQRLPVLTR